MRWWLIVAFLAILGAACSQSAASNQTAEVEMESNETVTTESGLQYKDLVVGEGEDAGGQVGGHAAFASEVGR